MKCINHLAKIESIRGALYNNDKIIDPYYIINDKNNFWDDDNTNAPAGLKLTFPKEVVIYRIEMYSRNNNGTIYDVKILADDKVICEKDFVSKDSPIIFSTFKNDVIAKEIKIFRYKNVDSVINKIVVYGEEYDKASLVLLNKDNDIYTLDEEHYDNTTQQFIPITDLKLDNLTDDIMKKYGFNSNESLLYPINFIKKIDNKKRYSVLPYNLNLINKNKSLEVNHSINGKLPNHATKQNITIQFWAKFNKSYKTLFSFDKYNLTFDNGKLGFNTRVNDYYYIDYQDYLEQWHHITAIFTCSGEDSIYIDGIKQSLIQNSISPKEKIITNDFYIGDKFDEDHNNKYHINNFKIWDCIRTKEEIKNDMSLTSKKDLEDNRLLGFYPMNDINEKTLIDISKSKNNLQTKEPNSISTDVPITNKFLFRINNKLYNLKENKLNLLDNHKSEETTAELINIHGISNYSSFNKELLSRYKNIELLISNECDNKDIYIDSGKFKPINKFKNIGNGEFNILSMDIDIEIPKVTDSLKEGAK